ncbi:thioredoxin-like isoform X2 [Dreissena polymorpha]|nr:thioredoxin-like isoform X2 [Dreissena polymorpha]
MKDAGGKVVAVDFTATWCGPCQMIKPLFEQLSQDCTNVLFWKVDVDQCEDIASEQGISAMPTFKFYRNGQKIDEFTGANKDKLTELVKKYNA